MLKKGIILLILSLIFSSCQGLRDFAEFSGVTKIVDDIKESNMHRLARKKDGWNAISNKEYKAEVEEVIKDISKRPINKEVQFEETTFIIPEGTKINQKIGNIVDEKTGYGIYIYFSGEDSWYRMYTPAVAFEKPDKGIYYKLMYNNSTTELAQKIIKINGFKDKGMDRERGEVIKDILKRPINKKVEFEGITLIIPENTMINRDGYLADMKTGHLVNISFFLKNEYSEISKKVKDKEYSMYFDRYDTYKANIGELAKRIIMINNFIVKEKISYYIMDENKEKRDYIKATIKANEK
ncbi:hypothetical protein [Fusobacterium sp. 1001295B_180824_G3]|uniref:hypothetical protein n=1 Tax=Fusobacterium sp. 1001295B_180824_G3 TaxID=2787123 RepID=UPI00189A6D64|nr:hypothetical protein [Fusobacterium sp. 1001295B_180824_G3]